MFEEEDFANGIVIAKRKGSVCAVTLSGSTSVSSWGENKLCTLPQSMRPLLQVHSPVCVQTVQGNYALFRIETNGDVSIQSKGDASYGPIWMFASVCYPVAS